MEPIVAEGRIVSVDPAGHRFVVKYDLNDTDRTVRTECGTCRGTGFVERSHCVGGIDNNLP